jgi:signal transduction histidine kinase
MATEAAFPGDASGAVVLRRLPRIRIKRPGIRAIVASFAIVLGAIAVTVMTTLVWTGIQLHQTTALLSRESRYLDHAASVYRALLEYRRFADLEDLAGVEDYTGDRIRATEEVEAKAREAESFIDMGGREASLLGIATHNSVEYVRLREEHRARIQSAPEEVTQLRPVFDRAIGAFAALDVVETELTERARSYAESAAKTAQAVSIASAALFALTMIALGFALHRLFARPLLQLAFAIRQFQSGVTDARASPSGAREIAEAAHSWNTMADVLLRQRAAQLVFLAGVAHDIRNPLSALKLGVHSLSVAQSMARNGRMLELVNRQVDRLARLVDDVLDATQIQAGHLKLRPERYDLKRSLSELVEFYSLTSRTHIISLTLPKEALVVHADPVRIEQVISNLLSNAIKYSPNGGRVEVRAGRARESVTFEVCDHGIGISSTDLVDIFTPFRRRAPEVAGGTGLGLSVAKRIVEAHHGTIEAESMLDVGTIFRVSLPLAKESTHTGNRLMNRIRC